MISRSRKIVFYGIALVIGLFLMDMLVGLSLPFLVKRKAVKEGLPEAKLTVVEHPYKSYMNKPGHSFHPGVVVDEYGHQVLNEDRNMAGTPKKPNEYRILFLGGSTTFQMWPFYMTELMNSQSKGRVFKAVNAGTGGYTSQENVIDLLISGFAYKPDMVVAYLPVNDIYWSVMYPDFKRDYTHMRIPLKILPQTKPDFAERRIHAYPFVRKAYDLIRAQQEYRKYVSRIDLTYYTNKQPIPWPKAPAFRGYDASFPQTVSALIDNIVDMKALCDAHHVRFVLITQKLFLYPFGYESRNPYADLMDTLTLKAIDSVKQAVMPLGVDVVEMGKIFPDEWNASAVHVVQTYFPDKKLNFKEKMAYDDMHFNPAALYLFAALAYEHIRDKL